MSPEARIPVWLYVVFGLQLLIALLFMALGWSMTVSLGQGRSASLIDILSLASPTLLVIACAILAVFALRKQNKSLAVLLAIAPLPASFVLFGVVGAI